MVECSISRVSFVQKHLILGSGEPLVFVVGDKVDNQHTKDADQDPNPIGHDTLRVPFHVLFAEIGKGQDGIYAGVHSWSPTS